MIYQTSRLARDRLHAALFERELRKVGVSIHYAMGGGDPDTPEGSMMIGIQQLFDEFERSKLSRETKRGMREASIQGYRAGGRAPYGYRRVTQAMPEGHKGDTDKSRVTLEPDREQAPVIGQIFDLFVGSKLSAKGVANVLNRPGGPPSPSHVDSARNLRGHWAASTISAILKNPVYTGRIVWNRLDFTEAKHSGGGARTQGQGGVGRDRRRTRPADLRRSLRGSPEPASARRSARQPHPARSAPTCSREWSAAWPDTSRSSMRGKARKGHNYYCCGYADSYGDTAAREAHGGQKFPSIREDRLEQAVMRFFEQRIFGPLRIDKLAKQLKAESRSKRRDGKLVGTRIRQQVAELDRKIKAQVIALENGIEPELVSERIGELREQKEALEDALADLGGERGEAEDEELERRLAAVPDLSESLRRASPQIKRQVFEAFDLQIAVDQTEGRVEISATVSEEVARALNTKDPLAREGLAVVPKDIAGAGFEPATCRVRVRLAFPRGPA